jgi:RHS repeat-associated protein
MYTSREYDAESRFYFYRARYYDPDTGRFMEEDPVPNLNQYAYVNNNPMLLTDPLGLNPWWRNFVFFAEWHNGFGQTNRYYDQNFAETQEMMRSPGADCLREEFMKQGNFKDQGYDTMRAFKETMLGSGFGSVAAQVGGFAGWATDTGDGYVQYTIENKAGTHSFFGGATLAKYGVHVPDSPFSVGPMRTITQTFTWRERKPCPVR